MDTTVHLYLTLKDRPERFDLGPHDFGFLPQGGEEPVLEWEGRAVRARINQIHIEFQEEPAPPIPFVHAQEI
jgi:hypothetical protein